MRMRLPAERGSAPKRRARPDVGLARPSIRETAVVFPAPFGPRTASTSPGMARRLTRSSAVTAP